MSEPQEKTGGIFASLRGILDGGLAIAHNRVELFAVELREEKCRLVEAIILASAAVAFGMMTLTLLTFLIVTLFWDNARIAALVVLSLLYLLAMFLAWRGLRARLDNRTAFSGTLGAIKKDRECLEPDK
jgi:uncharacterized membrane protein YqjE